MSKTIELETHYHRIENFYAHISISMGKQCLCKDSPESRWSLSMRRQLKPKYW